MYSYIISYREVSNMNWKKKKTKLTTSQKRNFTIMRLRGMVGQSKSIARDMSQLTGVMEAIRFDIDHALKMLNAKSQHDHERES